MAICPEGHQSRASDYCDECGLPIADTGGEAAQTAPVPAGPAGQECPNCHAANPADALFCEACGYDFVTGTLPRGSLAELLRQPFDQPEAPEKPAPDPDEPAQAAETGAPGSGASEPEVSESGVSEAQATGPKTSSEPEVSEPEVSEAQATEPETSSEPEESESETPAADVAEPEASELETSPPAPEDTPESEIPTGGRPAPTKPKRWVAELWIDPDWYRLQESPDPLPSPGLPQIFPLPAAGALIGRVSRSQNIDPDVDCGIDTGCSRRHAQLSTDGVRWWIEDLGSANGTFVGETNGPLPTTPITGRTELTDDSRVYIGGWTRMVVRPATEDEDELF